MCAALEVEKNIMFGRRVMIQLNVDLFFCRFRFDLHTWHVMIVHVHRVDGTNVPAGVEPFAPLRKRVVALERLASDATAAFAELGQQLAMAIATICDNYRWFVRAVCNFDVARPPRSHTLADLLAVEAQKEYRGRHLYVGGNATLGGAGLGGRYFRVSQRMVGTLTRLDEIGQVPR